MQTALELPINGTGANALGNTGQRQCCVNQTGAKKSPSPVLQSVFAKHPEQPSACVGNKAWYDTL